MALTLTANEKDSIEQILSAAGGEAINQAFRWLDLWKRKNGLEGGVYIDKNGKVVVIDSPAEAERKQAEELAAIQAAQAAKAKQRRSVLIAVGLILVLVGVYLYLKNKRG